MTKNNLLVRPNSGCHNGHAWSRSGIHTIRSKFNKQIEITAVIDRDRNNGLEIKALKVIDSQKKCIEIEIDI